MLIISFTNYSSRLRFYNGRTGFGYVSAIMRDMLAIDLGILESLKVERISIGEKIKSHRVEKGWSQSRLTKELGLAETQGSR